MELKITTFYCLCDDFLIYRGWRDDPQCTMSTAEAMTAASFITAAAFLSAVMKEAACFLSSMDICLPCFQKSQLSSSRGSIAESVWRGLTKQLAIRFHKMNSLKIYLADNLPAGTFVYDAAKYIKTNTSMDVFQVERNIFTG